jgi:hypothetical protein
MRPFLFRFARPIPLAPANPLRDDHYLQTSQVLGDGVWIEVLDVPANILSATRLTEVAQETTDDE